MLVKINGNQYLIKTDGSTKAKYGIDEYDVSTHPETYYGHYVTNYNIPNDAGIVDANGQLGKWQIFMADEDNIYLISSNYITVAYTGTKNGQGYNYKETVPTTMWFTEILKEYNANSITTDIPQLLSKFDTKTQTTYHKWMSTQTNQTRDYRNEKSVASMLDIDVWNGYNNTTYSKYSIGGPTIEMFCKAYNNSHTGDQLEAKDANPDNTNGYRIKKETTNSEITVSGLKTGAKNTLVDSMYFKSSNEGNCYWLASPSSATTYYVLRVGFTATIESYDCTYPSSGFRPLVCLKSNVHLVQNSDSQTYSLELD